MLDQPIVVKLPFLSSLMPSFEGNLLTQGTKFAHKTLETLRYSVNQESLSHVGLNQYRVVTDRITIASTLLLHVNCVAQWLSG